MDILAAHEMPVFFFCVFDREIRSSSNERKCPLVVKKPARSKEDRRRRMKVGLVSNKSVFALQRPAENKKIC